MMGCVGEPLVQLKLQVLTRMRAGIERSGSQVGTEKDQERRCDDLNAFVEPKPAPERCCKSFVPTTTM